MRAGNDVGRMPESGQVEHRPTLRESGVDPDKLVDPTSRLDNAGSERFEKGEVINPDKLKEPYYTTEKERIDICPPEGRFEGDPGNSKAFPDMETKEGKRASEKLAERGLDGIEYRKGVVDFGPVSEATVTIDNMTYRRAENFRKADVEAAEQFNRMGRGGRTDWTPADVKILRHDGKLSWHECSDMKTMMLVDRDIHDAFRHPGGIMECKRREGLTTERTFDE